MNKEKEIREALYAIREGVDLLINAIGREGVELKTDSAEIKAVKADVPTEPTVKVDTSAKPVSTSFDAEDLNSMAYNDLKKLAKDLGVSGAGSRDKIIRRILDVELTVREDGEVEVADEKPETAKTPKKPVTKLGKKSESAPVEEDPVYEQVVEATADMSLEDLGDILSEIGKSPKGKRQALIDKIYKAVKDGELSFDDEGEDEEEVETSDEQVEDEATDTDNTDEDEDDGVNDPDNMTEARKNACEEYENDIRNDFDTGDLSAGDMREFCIEFYGEENADAIGKYSDKEILDLYIDAAKRMIDDDGELIEEGAYSVNGEYFCCGRPLQYAEDTNKYVCEMCGAEYDAEL